MPLNIKNAEVERLVEDVARMAKETKTEAIRRALIERRDRLQARFGRMDRGQRLRDYLETEVWPFIPTEERGRTLTRAEEDDLLGYGPDGV